jgi:hypothetical protein
MGVWICYCGIGMLSTSKTVIQSLARQYARAIVPSDEKCDVWMISFRKGHKLDRWASVGLTTSGLTSCFH